MIIANHVWNKFETLAAVTAKTCSVNESFQSAPKPPPYPLLTPCGPWTTVWEPLP